MKKRGQFMNLGQATKLIRTASGLRQNELAKRLHVTANYISMVENGKREPSVSFLRELARVFNVPIGFFFLWEETGTRPIKRNVDHLRDLMAQLESMYVFANRPKIRKGRAA
jgi:transcriptional regulator with XRE-family HTH domain